MATDRVACLRPSWSEVRAALPCPPRSGRTYPGTVAVQTGRAYGHPIHVEARVTHLFGQEPLAHVARVTDGPWFLTLGGGVRYPFSLRAAFSAAVRVNAAFDGNGLLPTAGPEVGFQYGF